MAAVRPLVVKAGRVRMLPASDSLDWSWLSGIPAQLALWAGIAPTAKADTFHGHAVSDVTGLQAALDAKAVATIAVSAGNGLTGGGSLEANRTLTLGTPGAISGTSTNAVTATSHTHALDLTGAYTWAGAHTFNAIVTGSVSGNAGTATKLQTSRTVQVNLARTTATGFDGSANITPGVTGVLPVANGGTGANNAGYARTNLGVPSTTGSGASGTWPIAVTGNSAGVTAVTNLRGVKPNTSGQSVVSSVKAYFAAKEMLEGAASGTSYGDFLLLDTYSDGSGGMPNGLFFDKKSAQPAIYHYRGAWDSGAWNAPLKLAYEGHAHAISDITGLQTALDGTVKTLGNQTIQGVVVGHRFEGTTENPFRLGYGSTIDHGYISWHTTTDATVRTAYMGFGSSGSNVFSITNERNGRINLEGEFVHILDSNGGGMQLRPNGEIWRGDANDRTYQRRQPRIFVQAGDPGYAATDGDLWVW